MAQFNFYRLLLCYNFCSALAIQIISCFFSIIGIILTQIGIHKIPFYINNDIFEIFFTINIPYFLFIIIFNIIFFIFRCAKLMNNELNLWGYGLSIIEIYISIFGIITNIINDSMIFYNINDYQKSSMLKKTKKSTLTDGQLLYTKIILIIIFVIWINILFLAISDNVLINLKIDGSYNNYYKSMKIEKEIYVEQKKIEQIKRDKLKQSINKLNNVTKVKKNINNNLKTSIYSPLQEEKNNNNANVGNNIDKSYNTQIDNANIKQSTILFMNNFEENEEKKI